MSFLPQLAPPFIDTDHTRRLRTPLHTRLPSHDLLAERNTHHLHLAMMKLLTLALLFGVGAATSLRVDGTLAPRFAAVSQGGGWTLETCSQLTPVVGLGLGWATRYPTDKCCELFQAAKVRS